MTAPLTPYEVDGSWTSLAAETALFEQIAADTGATLTVAGHSVGGLPIHRLDIGTGTAWTWLIATLQHANELAPREGVLAFARDLAYSTDPAVIDYLTRHRVVFVTPCNPDRFNVDRNNANNVNLNRDHYELSQPETRAIASVIADTRPHLIMDCHGRDDLNSGADWEGQVTGIAAADPSLRSLAQELLAAMFTAAGTAGYSSRAYPGVRNGLDGAAGVHHAVGLLSESWGVQNTAGRVAILRHMLGQVRTWHSANAHRLAAVSHTSRSTARANRQPYPLQTQDQLADAVTTVLDPPPARYVVAGTLPETHVQAFGIDVDGDGSVSMYQPASRVIPLLCDPGSDDKVVTATRIASVPDGIEGGLRHPTQLRLRDGDQTVDVLALRLSVDGQTHTVWQP